MPRPIDVTENGVEYEQSTSVAARRPGCFSINARIARRRRSYARGRLLDCFSYNGGFALTLAPLSSEAIAFDVSEDAVARMRKNAAAQRRAVDARVGNVFDELRGLERLGERFDTIVLDPPAFAKNKAAVEKARRRLQGDQPARAEAAEPGRHARDVQLFVQRQRRRCSREIVYEAAVDAAAHVTVVEKRMQGRDHPVLLGVPETYYLKCFILRKL